MFKTKPIARESLINISINLSKSRKLISKPAYKLNVTEDQP